MDPTRVWTTAPVATALAGRTFLHPLFDYLVIGGGASLVIVAIVAMNEGLRLGSVALAGSAISLQWAVALACNSAHFAASSVRLYTKPDSFESLPFVTMAFPLIALGLCTLAVYDAEILGPHVQSLYLTWSPYHYAAQAYGLAVMYSYRSGCLLDPPEKRWLRFACLLPFWLSFVAGPDVGLGWLLPGTWLAATPVAAARGALAHGLAVLVFGAPALLYVASWLRRGRPLPLICVLLPLSNGVWWVVLGYRDAFVWATVFHGLQYLAIAVIFHVRDQMALPGNRHGGAFHALRFYAWSLLLGYGLFECLPQAYLLAGFGVVESMLMVVATINLHHFFVDAFIWRLGSRDGNRQIVERGALAATLAVTRSGP